MCVRWNVYEIAPRNLDTDVPESSAPLRFFTISRTHTIDFSRILERWKPDFKRQLTHLLVTTLANPGKKTNGHLQKACQTCWKPESTTQHTPSERCTHTFKGISQTTGAEIRNTTHTSRTTTNMHTHTFKNIA